PFAVGSGLIVARSRLPILPRLAAFTSGPGGGKSESSERRKLLTIEVPYFRGKRCRRDNCFVQGVPIFRYLPYPFPFAERNPVQNEPGENESRLLPLRHA